MAQLGEAQFLLGKRLIGPLNAAVEIDSLAVLSEALFLSASAAEAQLLARPEVQRGEGEAIARAVRRFLETDAPGSGFVASRPRGPEGSRQNPPCVDPTLE